ncbi:MAG TPA: hypothetical protein VHN14_19960 [Kofleriaceae bacterium]|nr:hypothetical protein [Kofleriaceae bacterium]
MNRHTVFGDLRQRAIAVYRVKTQSSEYILGIHEQRGRKFVIVRGQPGTDREHVVVRDSDPRIAERSLFEVPIAEWPGQVLEVATMTSSVIAAVVAETDPAAIAAVGLDGKIERTPWARPDPDASAQASFPLPLPPGMSSSPRIVPIGGRGTTPGEAAMRLDDQHYQHAKQVVVGQPAPVPVSSSGANGQVELPYPQRHVGYAESVTQLLRAIARRDRLFDDIGDNRELRNRLRNALDEAVTLLEQIRRRDRK